MSSLGKINPYVNKTEHIEPQKKTSANQQAGELGFAKTLEEFIGTKKSDTPTNTLTNEQVSFLNEINDPEHLQERIEHYQSFATSEEQKMYVEMLKYFKENNHD